MFGQVLFTLQLSFFSYLAMACEFWFIQLYKTWVEVGCQLKAKNAFQIEAISQLVLKFGDLCCKKYCVWKDFKSLHWQECY